MNLREEFIARKASGRRFAALTAYDYAFARLLDPCGLDFLLVGDSLGMIQLGMPDTVEVSMEHMLHHTRAVAAGTRLTPLFADLPGGSTASPETALTSARALVDAGAHGVKIEGGRDVLPCIHALHSAGLPFLGHLGMLPQRVREEGGYKIKGRDPSSARSLLDDARHLEDSGAIAIVLELVDPRAAATIASTLTIPTIGIGSGNQCDGSILVTHDLVGLFPWFRPRFVKPEADLASTFTEAVARFRSSA